MDFYLWVHRVGYMIYSDNKRNPAISAFWSNVSAMDLLYVPPLAGMKNSLMRPSRGVDLMTYWCFS